MKSISTVWLHVCLYSVLSLSSVTIASAAAANGASASGDVPASVRTSDETNRQLNTSAVLKSDLQILDRARAANEDVYSSLQSFVCDEEMNRYKGSLNSQVARPLDKVTAKLSFERGVEQYSNVQQNNRPRTSLSSLTGAWSEGEFGTLLLQTQQLLALEKVDFDSFTDLAGEQAAVYHFDVPAEQSPWDLMVAGKHYRLPFRTQVWISVNTGEILKINRATTSIASDTRISGIEWAISLQHFAINGKTWLLPATGSYSVLYNESKHREWNEISFTGYHRYGSEAALKFE